MKLDERGRIDTMRLVPTRRSLDLPAPTRRSFEVGAIEDLPANARNRVQLTSTIAAPDDDANYWRIFIFLAVEMAPNLEIGALLVKAHAGSVRVTLDRQTSAPEANAAIFDYSSVKLDVSARIVELSLIPLD